MYSLVQLWIGVRSNLWFVPSLLVSGAIAIAVGLIQLDETLGGAWLGRWPRLFGAGAEGSRGMLTAIATSMITVAGVTFSITVAALAQASSQYSPLILRNFMEDRANQVVLGVFGGIFVYCLIVLRSIRGGEEPFVPSIAVFVALLHALAGIGFLLFFIHHIATVLQASSILAAVARSTLNAIETLFPEELAKGADEQRRTSEVDLASRAWHSVQPHRTGYIQAVRSEAMLKFARENDAVVRMERGVGDFAIAGVPVASVALESEPDESVLATVADFFVVADFRTIDQDASFGIRQIVDMAVKALSPGINDPSTACSCLDYLGAVLVRVASRELTSPERYESGRLRVIATGPTFNGLVDLAFEQIRQNARADAAVLNCMTDVIKLVATHARSGPRKEVLLKHLALVAEHADGVLELEADKQRFARRVADAVRAIDASA